MRLFLAPMARLRAIRLSRVQILPRAETRLARDVPITLTFLRLCAREMANKTGLKLSSVVDHTGGKRGGSSVLVTCLDQA